MSKKTFSKIVRNVDISNIEQVASIVPFLDKDVVGELFEKSLNSGKEINWENIKALAPFLDEETLDELVDHALKNETKGKYERNNKSCTIFE